MSAGPHFSVDLMERVAALRAQGLPWVTVAERLGQSRHSLESVYCRWRKGKTGERWRATTLIERMVEHVEKEGRSAGWIARKYGRSIQSVCVNLARRGLDAEMRAMWGEYHSRRAPA